MNTGSFMSGAAGGTNGIGPELAKLIQQPGATPGILNQDSQTLPPQAPTTQAVPTAMTNNIHPQTGQPIMGSQPPVQTGQAMQPTDPDLSLVLHAMKDFVKHKQNIAEAHAGIQK